jgi:hypothetical protein
MPQTYREYPVYELALVTYSNARNDGGLVRYQAGDIVEARHPQDGIGLGECHHFLWLRVYGWDSSLMDRLKDEITDKSRADPLYVDEDDPAVIFEKARYCVPLESMIRIMPTFSVERASDSTDIYQPFMTIDHGNIVDFPSASLEVKVNPLIWLPKIVDDVNLLEVMVSQVDEDTILTLPRTMVDPNFADAAIDAGLFLITYPPVHLDGLIFDKFTQRYLYA